MRECEVFHSSTAVYNPSWQRGPVSTVSCAFNHEHERGGLPFDRFSEDLFLKERLDLTAQMFREENTDGLLEKGLEKVHIGGKIPQIEESTGNDAKVRGEVLLPWGAEKPRGIETVDTGLLVVKEEPQKT